MAQDYYQLLGVGRGASAEEIQQAYRRLARRYHPDVNRGPEAEERFKEIGEAYRVLSDPKTRARYDRFGADFRRIPEDYDGRVTAGPDFGQAGRGWSRTGRVRAEPSFGGADFADGTDFADFADRGFGRAGPGGAGLGGSIFGDLFGAHGATGPIPGADQEAELELTVEEAYRGGRRQITLAGPGGSPRSYQVTIPRGVVEGQRVRLAGQGGRGSRHGQPGDLYLHVKIAPHPYYRLSGRDINVPLPVTPWEAALGARVPVTTPGGEIKVRVPAGSSSGRRLRLRGAGLPNPTGPPGDLHAEVRVAVPPALTARERALFEQLAAVSAFDPRT
ncbi:DnaJ C-terminal domain-containing protein [Frankia sp. BMG5.23]|uniref:DnaJ C-terminal domain-containing protein n=1 Tax=Frankia sp. BMG5.23 TaxID=683305 RepID=UPI0004611C08|nr:DnaJ C-terminal domain-containing protein [Frankia sp. BMG5.23]KDA40869.1 DnaJ-class molecular chaperone with C-terminal Zn finger domain [Frankia sp. BMG5.23]